MTQHLGVAILSVPRCRVISGKNLRAIKAHTHEIAAQIIAVFEYEIQTVDWVNPIRDFALR
jgi:hypothetical protein